MTTVPAVTHWIDTSVMVDFDTTISMSKNHHYGPSAVIETRRSMQRAAWMAIACDEIGAVSISFDHEHGRKLKNEAPPGTLEGQWTHVVMNIVRPYACPRWRVLHTSDGRTIQTAHGERVASNDERDSFMIDASKRNNMVLITSDGPAFKRAKRAGAEVYRPAEYAGRIVSFEVARDRFLTRLDAGIRAFLAEHPGGHSYDNANVIWESYEGVWDEELRC
jgi:hypothetical protein